MQSLSHACPRPHPRSPAHHLYAKLLFRASTTTSGWGNFSLRGGPFLMPLHSSTAGEGKGGRVRGARAPPRRRPPIPWHSLLPSSFTRDTSKLFLRGCRGLMSTGRWAMAPRRAALTAAASRPNTRQLLLGRHGREVSGPPGGGDPRDTTPPPSTLAPGPAHQCSITTRGPVPPGLLSPSARARFWGAPASSGASAAAGCWAPRFLRRGAILGEPPGPGNGGGEATAGSRCGEREGVAGVLPRGGAPEIPQLGEGCVPTGIPLWEGVRRGRSPRIPTGTLRWGVGVPGMPARGEGEGRGRYGAGRQPGSRSRGTAPPRRLLPAAPRRPRAGIAGRRAGLRHSGEPPGGVGVGEGRVSGMNGPPDPAGWGTGLPPPPLRRRTPSRDRLALPGPAAAGQPGPL